MSQRTFQRRPTDTGTIPNVIFFLLIANGLMFVMQQPQFAAEFTTRYLALWSLGTPYAEFYPWQLLTYGFLHGGFTHILFNMWMLWMFGRELELLMGPKRFLIGQCALACPPSFLSGVLPSMTIISHFWNKGFPPWI